MQVADHKVVAIEYTLKNDAGEILDAAQGEPLAYLHGAHNIIPGLEAALEGKRAGEQLSVRVAPADAYGEHNPAMVQDVPREMFGDAEVEVGGQFHAAGPDGQPLVITVMEVKDDAVQIDANHPLAGEHLTFEVKIVDVREATAEEISHGHVHGHGGHHHHD